MEDNIVIKGIIDGKEVKTELSSEFRFQGAEALLGRTTREL